MGFLSRQHEERRGQREGIVADSDLVLLHGLQQRALHLRGRAIDLVGQHDVGEDRTFARREIAGACVVNEGADDVGRQQVGRELNAAE